MSDVVDTSAEIAREVLQYALSQVPSLVSNYAEFPTKKWGANFGKRWIGALHDGFQSVYAHDKSVAVLSRARTASGPVETWRRQEYMFDVVVAEAERRPAPFHVKASIPVIKRSIWQVESEVVQDAQGVAEDLGKLVLGSAEASLLIAAFPSTEERLEGWVRFIQAAAAHIENKFFLALVPTYSTRNSHHRLWVDGRASVRFYSRLNGRLVEDEKPISVLTARQTLA